TLFIDGKKQEGSGGARREVTTPTLEGGRVSAHEVKAVWEQDGKTVERVERLTLRAGDAQSVLFLPEPPRWRAPRSEPVPLLDDEQQAQDAAAALDHERPELQVVQSAGGHALQQLPGVAAQPARGRGRVSGQAPAQEAHHPLGPGEVEAGQDLVD